jgi:cation transport regulator ChaC
MPNDLWYFAYGSNLDLERKQHRTGAIRESHLATLSGYRLAFNKKGSNGDFYANLFADPTEETLGVIYRCTSETLDTLDVSVQAPRLDLLKPRLADIPKVC